MLAARAQKVILDDPITCWACELRPRSVSHFKSDRPGSKGAGAIRNGEICLRAGRELVMTAGLGDPVLPDFVEQGLVTYFEERGRLLTVPVGLLQSLCDGRCFGFIFRAAR